jgi:hypothetical protein
MIYIILLLAQLPVPYETRVFLEADGQYLIFARFYEDDLISIDSVKSVNEYLQDGLMLRNQGLLLEELRKDIIQSGGYASQGLFGTFEIPLPKGKFSEFMGETGKLDVGGYVKITVGGSQTFITNQTAENRVPFLPELELKQEMAVSLDGQVGDRMRVFIDHNSERINESQNKITVTYQGREDEIIQEIEGGDTDLSIPATTYTGDIPSHEGLFGIKSAAKFGPMDVVAIASKEQTQSQEIEIEGSVQADTNHIPAKQYERRRFFWLGTFDNILDLQVYVDDNNAQNNNQEPTWFGIAYLDTNDDNLPDTTSMPTDRHEGYFTRKYEGSGEYYLFIPGENTIELNYSLSNSYVLGVCYKKVVGTDTVWVGVPPVTSKDTIYLKLICPKQLDTLSYTRHYERKNYYQVVVPGSRLDTLRIFYQGGGEQAKDRQDDISYIQLLRLDVSPQDGLVDENIVFFPSRGLLRFPDQEPFASDTLNDPDPEIYTDPYYEGQGKYYLFTKTTESKKRFTLPENVETVYVYIDGEIQDPVRDYHVDYDAGILELKKPILPTQTVRIKVEYSPFFSSAEKSLVGMRASLRPFGDAVLGSSFFYRTESYPAVDHIRLREEPFNRMVWEVDLSCPQDLPFITQAVDWLPLVETEATSRLSVNAEAAYSFSDLNAKKEVWLDDLESSTVISHDVSVNKPNWVMSSKPIGRDDSLFAMQRLIWYNLRDEDRLLAQDIYIDPLDENESAEVLKVVFSPDDTLSFAGIMQYVYGENYDEVENLEIILNGRGGVMHVDFAQEIDEDQLRRNANGALVGQGTLEDEDANRNYVWNQYNEDTGLDRVYGDDGSGVAGDDGNDDYDDYGFSGAINGTENNSLWDTEDIDRNGSLNNENRLASYAIDLDDTTSGAYFIDQSGLQPGWKMFRVPIKDSTSMDTIIGQPDWHDIRYVRVWFDGFAGPETLLLYKLSTTGSRWRNLGIAGHDLQNRSEAFTVTPVNTKTHTYYLPPYPTEVDEYGQPKSEGGLEFRINDLETGNACVAQRLTDENEDYRAYDTLTFFFHTKQSNPLISIRFGTDSLNYYEYTEEFENGTPAFNDYRLFHVSLQRFIELKGQRASYYDTNTVSDSNYTVKGRPSIASNRFLEVRLTNQFLTSLSDTIWFNDVKLRAPRQETGRIVRGSGSLQFADLASMSVAFDESNGRFKRLSESKDIAVQSAGRSYSANATVNLNKFLPQQWGFSIPVSGNYRNAYYEPRFSSFADDIEISGDASTEEKSTLVQQSYSVHVAKSGSRNWFVKNTLDRLAFDHDRSQTFSRTALSKDTTDNTNYRAAYSLDPKWEVRFLKQSFSFLPRNISLNALFTDNSIKTYKRYSLDSLYKPDSTGSRRRKTLTPNMAVTYSPHRIMSTTYNFSMVRDSVLGRKQLGEEVGRNQSLNASVAQNVLIFSPRLTYNSSYSEDYRFEIRQDTLDLRNVNNSGRYGIDLQVDVKKILTLFAGLRDETKDSLAVTGSPSWFARQVEKAASYLTNPSLDYYRQRTSNYINVKRRPDPEYQWGLIDSLPEEIQTPGSYPGRGMTDTYSGSSGLNFRFLTLTGGYSGSVNRTFTYGGKELRTTTAVYPNLFVRILRLEALPFFKSWCRQVSLSTSFGQSYEERDEVRPDTIDPVQVSDSKSLMLSPLAGVQLTWKNGISTSVDITYTQTLGNDYASGIPLTSKMVTQGATANLAYTFSAPKGISLPLLRGIKFTSNLSLNLGANYSQTTNYYSDLFEPTNESKTYGGSLGLSYNFSSSVTGGANVDYTQNEDMNSEQDTRRISLNIWTNINF